MDKTKLKKICAFNIIALENVILGLLIKPSVNFFMRSYNLEFERVTSYTRTNNDESLGKNFTFKYCQLDVIII